MGNARYLLNLSNTSIVRKPNASIQRYNLESKSLKWKILTIKMATIYSRTTFSNWASVCNFQCGRCDQQSLRSAWAYAQSDQSLCLSLEYSMIVKLLTKHHLVFLSLKGGCTGSSESTLVKMPNCRKSQVAFQLWYSAKKHINAWYFIWIICFTQKIKKDITKFVVCSRCGWH